MKTVFFLILLLTLGSCRYFYRSLKRNYYSGISSTATSIAVAPSSIVYNQNYTVDFAIGTQNGQICLGYLYYYSIECVPNITSSAIKNLTWTQKGLHIVSEKQIRVIDPQNQNQNILTLNFTDSIYSAVFDYSNNSQTIFTAISFSDRLQVFQNTTSLYNISLFEPCYSMSFNTKKHDLYFIIRKSSNESSFMYRFNIPSTNLYNTTISSQYVQTSLSFVPIEGYDHFSTSTNEKGLVTWGKYDSVQMDTNNFTFSNIKFTLNGEFLAGPLGSSPLEKAKYFGILPIFLSSDSFYVPSSWSQNISLDTYFVDFDVRREQIVILTDEEQVVLLQIPTDYETQEDSKTWIIIVASIVGFLLVAGIIGAIFFKVRKLRRKNSQLNTQQDEVTSQAVQSGQRFPPIKYNDIQNQNFYRNQANQNEQFYNSPYRPPQ